MEWQPISTVPMGGRYSLKHTLNDGSARVVPLAFQDAMSGEFVEIELNGDIVRMLNNVTHWKVPAPPVSKGEAT